MRKKGSYVGLFLALTVMSGARARADNPVLTVPTQLPGILFVPADGLPHPGVLLLHGLEGLQTPANSGTSDRVTEARLLASHGFAAFAFCWFGCQASATTPGVPAAPQGIDLSRTYEAFRWLRTSQYVQGKPTAIYGFARGAEQALVLSVYLAKHPQYFSPAAVVAHAPSEQIAPEVAGLPTWTWQGDLRGLQPGSAIRLDRYTGGLLVTQGLDDSPQAVSASKDFEHALRSAGTAVRTLIQESDPSLPPLIVDPAGSTKARADFHYFKGEGIVFDRAMDVVRINSIMTYLKNSLGE